MLRRVSAPDVVLSGLAFPECPRWYGGALWVTDVAAGQVLRWVPGADSAEVVCEVEGHPAGTGFLPDGRLLVAAGDRRQVLRREHDGSLVVHADLSHLATAQLNDMHVTPDGRAYVGNYGDDSAPPAPPHPAVLALVMPDGQVRAAADQMLFANGIATTADGRTLVVAETRATPGRLTRFRVEEDGSLGERQVLAELEPGVLPDGIALDGDSVWVASPFSDQVLRVDLADGTLREVLAVPTPYAVALGGHDGRDLFVCTAPTWVPADALALRGGQVLRVRVGD
ncbi:gluconolaconase [Nocardioides sp. zg-DK7169]|nr:SMP-30/gluconolactonase/LRE family protein [Nocardioides sp. zg-DK7169]NPC97805.1 gluconolaconase [Nocardioides sp. zg-DK7169]